MRRFGDILRNFNKIDSILAEPNLKKYRRQSIRLILAVYCLFTSVMIFDIFYWTRSSCPGGKSGSHYILDYCGFYFLYYIMITLELYFSHLVYSIHMKLFLINEYLVISDLRNNLKNNIIMVNSQIDNFHLESLWHRQHQDSKIFFKIRMPESSFTNAQRIKILRKLHKLLNYGVDIINGTIANGIMLIMLSCLVHLIVTPYFLVAELIKEKSNILFIFLQIFWIITHTCRLLIIVEPCQACSLEGQRTNMLLCDLLLLNNTDDEFEKAVKSFSLYLSQNHIRFSCSGLFTIDRSLITSIAGSVTTYIVILFQFNNN
ncbi:unnamed protein product [Phaedon cochleariae]|uniref:Gustatory receptor n=1 Tax=Phaedon cochleariae TaxID=80249 RepID=A0A9N9SH73_PHACE|nr:unnamed protein product [Phaedon cochleariae]